MAQRGDLRFFFIASHPTNIATPSITNALLALTRLGATLKSGSLNMSESVATLIAVTAEGDIAQSPNDRKARASMVIEALRDCLMLSPP
jgi:hypothetical protein